MSDLPRIPKLVCVAVILLVGALAHGLCLGSDYYMDDNLMYTPEFLEWENGGWREWTYRLIPGLLSALTFKIFGDSSMAQHLWNLAIHLSLSVVVFWGAAVFLDAGKVFKDRAQLRRAAFFAGLIFACHPIGSEAVNYARCTRIQWVALFSVLAAIGTLRFCQEANWKAGIGTVAVVVFAAFSKDPGLLHAMGNVMIVVVVFAKWGAVTRRLRRPIDWAVALLGVAAFFWIGLNKFTTWWFLKAKAAVSGGATLNFSEHALTQGRVFWAYMQRIFAPVNLSSDHYIPMTRTTADLPAVVMTGGVVLLTAAMVWMMFRERFRMFGVLGMLALAPLLLRFLYPISEFMVEYRVYPALPWIAMLAGIGFAALYQKKPQVMKFAMVVLVLGGVLGSAMRSAVWQDAETLCENVLEQYPSNNRARHELQFIAYQNEDYEKVLALRKDVIDGVNWVGLYNQDWERFGRKYLVEWANEWFIMSEAKCAVTLADVVSSEAGIAHIDRAIAQIGANHPDYFDKSQRTYKYGKPLVELRKLIIEKGSIQDQRRLDRAAVLSNGEPE